MAEGALSESNGDIIAPVEADYPRHWAVKNPVEITQGAPVIKQAIHCGVVWGLGHGVC